MSTTERPPWATDYTPRFPDCVDPSRPFYTIEVRGQTPDPGYCGHCPYGWPLVGRTIRPNRRFWWWPFGETWWVTEYHFQHPGGPD